MPPSVDPSVLRRKIAAHARAAPKGPDPDAAAGHGFGRALRHAAAPFEGLGLLLLDVKTAAGQDLDAAIAALPEEGLVAALEEAGGARGLVTVSQGLVNALVEVQTTGVVEPADLSSRPVTRIDEALVRDFIDFALAAFAREAAAVAGRDWPERMTYGSRVRDRGQINLLLPDGPYRVLTAELGFEGVERRARFALVLPCAAAHATADPAAPASRPPDARWLAARARMRDRLRLPLEAVLMRVTRPLAEVQGLQVGDLIPFGAADLREVALETTTGASIVHGRLGQVGGRRALRMPGAGAGAPQPPAPGPAKAPEPGMTEVGAGTPPAMRDLPGPAGVATSGSGAVQATG